MSTQIAVRLLAGVVALFFVTGAWAQSLLLPAPKKTGGLPLMDALAKRATVRAFDSREIPLQQLSSLLWASFGINRPDGKRTAPSALNRQEADLYVLLKQGAYLYNAVSNQLDLVTREDLRKLGGTQDFVTNAPVTMVIVADLAKMDGTNVATKVNIANLDAGYISQNMYLYCSSEGLATGARLSVNTTALAPRLKLRPDQRILLAHSFGYPAGER
jgi:nitroreductase